MHSFWKFFIERRQFTILLIAALVSAGTVSLISIPKESAPEVEIPMGVVTTVLPGASATDVEKLITKKIEDEVANVSNLHKLTSSSRDSVSVISAEFEASANLDQSISDLKDAVDRAKSSLPSDAKDPTITRINFADQPILIVSVSGSYQPKELSDLSDTLKNELKGVSGVSKVEVSGVQKRQVSVVVHSAALSQYGIRLNDIIAAIGANNASLPIGSITIDGVDYSLRFNGDITNTEEVANLPIGLVGGRTLYLRDVATVFDGLEKPISYSRVSVEGKPAENALTLFVYKKSGGNVVNTATAAKKKLTELKKGILEGSTITVTYDLGKNVNKDLSELTRVGFETVLLVMIALFVTIGWRAAIVAGLSIPLSFVIAFIGLYASGNTINFVSLFSLILAVGILVDSGIVVTEAIHTRFNKYGDAVQAAFESIREYSLPLIAGTMTTVAMFIPLFFLSGTTGKFIASIPFTIIFVLIASIFVALGFVPLIAIMFAKKGEDDLAKLQEKYNEKFRTWYKDTLRKFLRDRKAQNLFLRGLAIAFVISLLLPVTGLVKVVFFPGGDSDFFYVELEKPQGTTLAETDLAVRAVEEILYENKNLESFVTTIGAGSTFGTGGAGSKLANITVNLPAKHKKPSAEIAEEVRKSLIPIHSLTWRIIEEQGGPPTGAPILIKFKGSNLDDLATATAKGEQLLASIPGTRDVTSSMKDDNAEFVLTIDKTKAAEVGLSPAAVAGILRTSITGAKATSIAEDEHDVEVKVLLDLNPAFTNESDTAVATIDDIRHISISTPRGAILLGSLLDTSLAKSNAVINREDRDRIASISAYLKKGATAVEVSNTFSKRKGELSLPKGVTLTLGGENEDVNKSFQEMFMALIAGLMLMFAILVLEFNSFRYTGYLLLTVPLSLIGVLGGLAITGQTLSFPSMLGVIALAGIIINHAIILLDSMYHLIEKEKTMSLEDIVVESAAVRLRPIILTTVTTVLGMIPLAGASALWGPLAFAVMFGLTFAMVLTLILIPLLFYRWPGKGRAASRA